MKLSTKMLNICAAAVVSMIILFAVNYYATNLVKNATTLSQLRSSQLSMTNEMQLAQSALLLAAMDSIIDRSDGNISDERMAVIVDSEKILRDGLIKAKETSDTDQEKKLAQGMVSNVDNLVAGIKIDLVELITESGNANVAIEKEFAKMDDTLDLYGDSLTESLANLVASIGQRIKNTQDSAIMEGIHLGYEMELAATNLILAAMDSIIDKSEGSINDERMAEIKKRAAYLTTNVSKLAAFATSDQEQKLISQIQNSIPQLIKGVQVDLVDLIDNSASRLAQIDQDFANTDDVLDQYGDSLSEQLKEYTSSIKEEVVETDGALLEQLKSSNTISITVFIIALVVFITLVTKITLSIIRPINLAVKDMTSGADQVSGSADQLSSSSQTLAESTSEQAAALEETSATMEELTSMTDQNADNAFQADSLMSETLTVITSAGESMDEMNRSMEDISTASEETSKIVKTIDEIAFQTNLLALNAAVEAARAGEAGAGFAVVADEVRNLAMRAAEAAKNTADLIEGIVTKVHSGKAIVTKIDSAFKEVAENSAKVGSLVGEISVASKEQSTGFTQISQAITQMDGVTQQNSATSEESAAASEELNAQAKVMMDVVLRLRSMVEGAGSHVSTAKKSQAKKQAAPNPHSATASRPAIASLAPPATTKAPKKAAPRTSPDEIIPMDDEFEDF